MRIKNVWNNIKTDTQKIKDKAEEKIEPIKPYAGLILADVAIIAAAIGGAAYAMHIQKKYTDMDEQPSSDADGAINEDEFDVTFDDQLPEPEEDTGDPVDDGINVTEHDSAIDE